MRIRRPLSVLSECMNTNLLLSRHFLNVVVHAMDYYIEHADINDPMERERVAAAQTVRERYSDALNELRTRKQNKYFKFKIK